MNCEKFPCLFLKKNIPYDGHESTRYHHLHFEKNLVKAPKIIRKRHIAANAVLVILNKMKNRFTFRYNVNFLSHLARLHTQNTQNAVR